MGKSHNKFRPTTMYISTKFHPHPSSRVEDETWESKSLAFVVLNVFFANAKDPSLLRSDVYR